MEIVFDNCLATLVANTKSDQDVAHQLAKELSAPAPGAKYIKAHKVYLRSGGRRGWDGKAHMMDGAQFPTGLIEEALRVLSLYGVNPTLTDRRSIRNLSKFCAHDVPLRDYQNEALLSVMLNTLNGAWNPRGVLSMATGSGKTEVAAAIYQSLPVPTLFLVHRKDLMVQTIDRFKKYNVTAGQLGAGKRNLKENVTVATVQTLDSILNRTGAGRDELLDYLCNKVEMVFFDEAHLLAADLQRGNIFIRVSRLMKSAYARIGLTATPFMRDNYSNWLLEGETGPARYQITNQTLIGDGFLAEPIVHMMKVPPVDDIKGAWQNQYDLGIVSYRPRNKLVVDAIGKSPKPALVMVSRVAHAKILQSAAAIRGMDIPVLKGDSPLQERKRVSKLLRDKKIDAVICTTIFDEGIDIPSLRTIILAGGGKSKIKGLQRVGRGLRTDDGKEDVKIVDFYDAQAPMLKSHSTARKKLWREQGFKIKLHDYEE